MHRPIYVFALLDYIKTVIRYREYSYLNSEPFLSIFSAYSNEPVVSNIGRDLANHNFIEALSQIHSYEQGNSQIYRIYSSIKKDYFSVVGEYTTDEAVEMMQDNYGIMESEKVVNLLELQKRFTEEHQITDFP